MRSLLSDGRVSVGIFGDGGANTGRVWEFTNLAAIWKLPLIAVCENNLYAVETPSASVTGGRSVARPSGRFRLAADVVDGQDIVAVHDAVTAAAERARDGDGPTFLEIQTYRYKGHDCGQTIRYRTEEEVAVLAVVARSHRAVHRPADRCRPARRRRG